MPSVVLAVNVGRGVDMAAAQAWIDDTRGELAAMFEGKLAVHARAFALDCRKPKSDAIRGLCTVLAVRACWSHHSCSFSFVFIPCMFAFVFWRAIPKQISLYWCFNDFFLPQP